MRYLLFALLFVLPLSSFAYEPTQTHAGLTEQVVEFYNLKSDKKISSQQKELVITGAMDEDEPATRAVNHFYDPVRKIGVEGGRTAKTWALDDLEANNFSWNKAIAAYARGDMDTAFIALGHNIHLIEDMGVPDHTRNDQHLPFLDENMGGHSPYEDWAKEQKNRQTMRGFAQGLFNTGVAPRLLSQLGEYFDFLANYSNKNFFSRDTIFRQDIYAKPQVVSYDQGYGYWIDEVSHESTPVVKRKKNDDGIIKLTISDGDDTSVLASYFDRLSRQIIPSGAGVIELFFKEGEQARIAYQAELRKQQDVEAQANAELARTLAQKGFFGSMWSGMVFLVQDNVITPVSAYAVQPIGKFVATAGRWVGQESPVAANMAAFATVAMAIDAKDRTRSAGEWTAQKAAQTLTIIQQTINSTLDTPVDPRSQLAGPIYLIDDMPTPLETGTLVTPDVPANTPSSAPRLVFIGNLSPGFGGGGGGGSSPAPEVLGSTVETPEVPQESTPEVEPETPAVLKQLSAPALAVPQCEQTLATDGCLLATTNVHVEWDEVPDAVYYAISKNGAYATTTSAVLDVVAPDFSDYMFEVAAIDANGQASATSTKTISIATVPVAINEVAWMGTVAGTSDEWLELKNNTAHTIDLSQWALEAKDGKPYIKLLGVINPREYIVFERTNDETIKDVVAHGVYTGALNDAGDQISLSYASTTLDKTPDGKWVTGTTTARQTMERHSSKELGTDPANWGTNLGYIKNGIDAEGNPINGTPGAQNSVSTLINKGQDITSDFTLTSDEERYVVPSGVLVTASSTLTIEEGVKISFLRDSQGHDGFLIVQGVVDAQGTDKNPITFGSFSGNKTGSFWFYNSTGTSTLDYASFENTKGVELNNTVLDVRNADFVNSDGGISAYEGSMVTVENSHFASSTSDTISAYSGSMVHIASSTIINQLAGTAIAAYDGSSLIVASTTIDGVENGDGVGIYDSILTIASSTIKNVSDDGIGLYNSTSTISNTVVENGGGNGVSIFGGEVTMVDTTVSGFVDGAGVMVSAPAEPVTITGGEITGNDIGVSMDVGSAILNNVSVDDNAQDVVVSP